MADEIRYSMNVSLANGNLNDSYNTSSLKADQTTQGLVRNVQPVGTTAAGDVVDMGSISTPRMAVFSNLDVLNFVQIGLQIGGTFYPFLKLDPETQAGPIWLGNTTPIYARADAGAVELFYILYEE